MAMARNPNMGRNLHNNLSAAQIILVYANCTKVASTPDIPASHTEYLH
jgi:hypothetical protein